MSNASISLSDQKPTPLKDAIKSQEKEYEDCTPCRLMGSAAFTGLGVYTWASGRRQLRERELEILKSGSRFGLAARRAGLLGMSALMVGLGAYRLVG